MAMEKELEIVCKTALDGQHVINVPAPLDGLTLAEARKVVEDLGLVLGKVSTRTRFPTS